MELVRGKNEVRTLIWRIKKKMTKKVSIYRKYACIVHVTAMSVRQDNNKTATATKTRIISSIEKKRDLTKWRWNIYALLITHQKKQHQLFFALECNNLMNEFLSLLKLNAEEEKKLFTVKARQKWLVSWNLFGLYQINVRLEFQHDKRRAQW